MPKGGGWVRKLRDSTKNGDGFVFRGLGTDKLRE